MNVYTFEVNPAPSRFFDKDDAGDASAIPEDFFTNTGNELAERLEVAYLERVDRYKQELERGYVQIRYGNFSLTGRRPTVKVGLVEGTESIVFDEELDARLMEIYVLYGWDGILKLEDALERAQQNRETRYTEPWEVILPFYLFTRNRLILLIRQALIDIEKKAAQVIITRLSLTATAVNTAWTQLQLTPISSGAEGGSGSDQTEPSSPRYEIGNKPLSDTLFLLLSEAVNATTYVQRIQSMIEEGEQEFGKGNAPGAASSQLDLEKTQPALASLYEQIYQLVPLALLALPLLQKGFKQSEMENLFGNILHPFRGKLDGLAQAINSEKSLVETLIPGLSASGTTSQLKLETLFPLGYNLEALCAEKAITETSTNSAVVAFLSADQPNFEVVESPAYLVLLSTETLKHLVESSSIEKGTLASIVCNRYSFVVMEQVEKHRKSKEALVKMLAKLQAALAIASIALPPLHIVSLLLGIPAGIFQLYYAIDQCTVFNQVINLRVIELDVTSKASIETLSAIGELMSQRAEYARQITEMIVKEIALIIAAGQWEIFKKGLLLRGYYVDLEVLLEG